MNSLPIIKSIIVITLFVLIIILMILELIFIYFKKVKLKNILKSIPLFLIGVIFLIIDFDKYYLLSLVALFYSIGDFFLLFKKKIYFVIGATSFLFGHLTLSAYIFLNNNINIYTIIFSLIFEIFIFVSIYFKGKRWIKDLTLTASFYFVVLSFNGFITLFNALNPILFIGVFIFFISDLFVMKERFFIKGRYTHLFVMFTYYLANLLIFSSFLLLL